MEVSRGKHHSNKGWGKLACARGGSRLSSEAGGGGVGEMHTCDRTYVWSSLSAFFFFYYAIHSRIFEYRQIVT